MSIRAILRHHYQGTQLSIPGKATPTSEPPSPVQITYLTVGGAVVEERVRRFTQETPTGLLGKLYGVPQSRERDGRVWDCLGCGAHWDSLRVGARNGNEHAGECRAMPKPEVSR